jgi:hypothetical protein
MVRLHIIVYTILVVANIYQGLWRTTIYLTFTL